MSDSFGIFFAISCSLPISVIQSGYTTIFSAIIGTLILYYYALSLRGNLPSLH